MSKVSSYITSTGVSLSDYKTCRSSADIKNSVNAVIVEGLKSGVTGTPKSYIFKNGTGIGVIDGAQPLSVVENLLDITQRY